ncbi:MAG: hypothetical protein AAFX04_10220 [Pseudomonadota bacterium]
MIFGPRMPVRRDEWEWLLAGFKWLEQEFGQDDVAPSPLILPTPDFFPPVSDDPDQAVADILDQVKAHCDMADWPTMLVIGEQNRPTQVGKAIHLVHNVQAPLGHFRLLSDADGQHIGEIAYNPEQRHDPVGLIATLAHELSHYLMAYAKTVMPGGEEMMEHSTDLCSVYLGFGVFLANNAFNFSASQGVGYAEWRTSAAGYLSERSLLTATAIREALYGRDPMDAAPYLKPSLAKDLKSISRYVLQSDLAAEIAAINLQDYGVIAYPLAASEEETAATNSSDASVNFDMDKQ